jgi:hypothetical protein
MKQYTAALNWINEPHNANGFTQQNLAIALKKLNGGKPTSAKMIVRRLLREGMIERKAGGSYRPIMVPETIVEEIDRAPFDQLRAAWERTPKMFRKEFFEYLVEHEGINEVDELVKGTSRFKEYRDVLSRKIDLEFGLDPLLKTKTA